MNRIFSQEDINAMHRGEYLNVYEKMGAHLAVEGGVSGTHFAVWAPNARSVSLLCDKNGWDGRRNPMSALDGVWECFVPGVGEGDTYRYRVVGADGVVRFKADPYAFGSELRPSNASVVTDIDNIKTSGDGYVRPHDPISSPISIYEVHLGSFKKDYTFSPDGFLDYVSLAHQLSEYVKYMNYTHVELMGICEYPFDGSWGYQVSGYYSPTRRYGSPRQFAEFIDILHKNGIGVILDFVPAHFCTDSFGLESFDGTPLYEYADPLRANYPEWGTKAFDLGKNEVSSFLIGAALFWINKYHIDALRIDAVAAMLFQSFGRREWRPNKDGGELNYESIAFFKKLNTEVKRAGAFIVAEDSSIYAGVTSPVEEGGLGFTFKWSLGWMNDTLKYLKEDPVFRKYHHGELTHTADYAFTENFVLVLSHDEVVHLKKPMIYKFPGNMQDKFGCLKVLYTHMAGHPGKKLLFMGQEFAQTSEWDENKIIPWEFASYPEHRAVMDTVRYLNDIYRSHGVLYCEDSRSFEWINRDDADRSIISYIRKYPDTYSGALVFACNFTPVDYNDFSLGVPLGGEYKFIFGTYGDMRGSVWATESLCDGRPFRLTFPLRAYEAVIIEMP